MPLITEALIDAGRSKAGKLSPGQIRLLTGHWVNAPGWQKRVLGQEIDQRTADLFLRKFPPPRPVKQPRYSQSDLRETILRQTRARRTRGILG